MQIEPTDEHFARFLEKLADRAADTQLEFSQNLFKSILLANGAALLASFTALANGRICSFSAVAPVFWLFAAGMLFGFSGQVLTFITGVSVVGKLSGLQMSASGLLNPKATNEQRDAARFTVKQSLLDWSKQTFGYSMVINTLYLLGTAAFVLALALPLVCSDVRGGICQAWPIESAPAKPIPPPSTPALASPQH